MQPYHVSIAHPLNPSTENSSTFPVASGIGQVISYPMDVLPPSVDMEELDIETKKGTSTHAPNDTISEDQLKVQPYHATIAHILNPSAEKSSTSPVASSVNQVIIPIDVLPPSVDLEELDMEAKQGPSSLTVNPITSSKHQRNTKRALRDQPNKEPRKVGRKSSFPDLDAAVSFRRSLRPIVKSTLWAQIRNRKFANGTFIPNPESEVKFKAKIKELDVNSDVIDSKTVRHHKCAKNLRMKEPYNVGNFKTHITNCKGPSKSQKLPAGGMKPIHTFFSKTPTSMKPEQISSSIIIPCPGLCETEYSRIETYLDRMGALGGGGSSVSAIAQELFGKKYRKLSASRKRQVKTAQTHEWLWRNDHSKGIVYSTNCTKEAQLSTMKNDGLPLLCSRCQSLFTNKKFKNAILLSPPDDGNKKYVNYEYRNERLATLFGRCHGLREIIEVNFLTFFFSSSDSENIC